MPQYPDSGIGRRCFARRASTRKTLPVGTAKSGPPSLRRSATTLSVATFAAAQLLRFVPRVKVSRAVGRLCELSLPPRVSHWAMSTYSAVYGVNLAEAERPARGYKSFDEFFTRRLKTNARSIADSALVSPADGRIVSAGAIVEKTTLLVKGQPYTTSELTGISGDADRYANGHFAVIYLSPRDYHRVHAPVDGLITEVQATDGDLFPVNSIGERHVPGLFVRNLRVAIAIDTECWGRVTVVMVGATIVGRITVTALESAAPSPQPRLPSPVAVCRGDEIGIFHLGSTVVMLTEKRLPIAAEPRAVVYGQDLMGPR